MFHLKSPVVLRLSVASSHTRLLNLHRRMKPRFAGGFIDG
ncbi:hypothetical protein ACPOL_2962 [Acidisarcina polymorpha]|uniref:Uncharacterized protein n=1 Tax=Acidisarcina polymorpha TaxID=2211140 RepID=A0A2Z5G0H5_9BACT|nr:hypothetical protein ACPOL_2962 [Acidisarcina polymorpha]